MELTKLQFDILAALAERADGASFNEIIDSIDEAEKSEICSVAALLEKDGLIDGVNVTEKGIEALEPYRAKRAIFLAAGFGSRLVPITLNTPKPLVRVNGTRIIDTLIDAVIAAGIEEIIIVRGYLGEVFDQLKVKYPNIKFVENPSYNKYNNISSVYLVRNLLQNAYVFESDLYLKNRDMVRKYNYYSCYPGVPVKETPDWCFTVENGRIVDLKKGGENCHHMYGIGYINRKDGERLGKDLGYVFENVPEYAQRFWDDVALVYYKDKYDVKIREFTFDDVIEIDTFDDLKAVDSAYC